MNAPPTSTRREIGQRIAEAIQTSPLTIDAVRGRLGVSDQTVLRWRAGENVPDLDHLLELSDLLEVNLHWLLTGRGPVDLP